MREPRERTITDAVQNSLALWLEATGKDPESDAYSNWGSFREDAEAIGRAQHIDDDALTAFMVLRESARRLAKNTTHTALDMIDDPEGVAKKMAVLQRLVRAVDDPVAMAAIEDFQQSLLEGARRAGLDDILDETIADISELAYVRRDALISRDILSVHTFRRGERAEGTLKYNEAVLKFWNVQSAVQAAMSQPENGISLCLVRDPVALWS